MSDVQHPVSQRFYSIRQSPSICASGIPRARVYWGGRGGLCARTRTRMGAILLGGSGCAFQAFRKVLPFTENTTDSALVRVLT